MGYANHQSRRTGRVRGDVGRVGLLPEKACGLDNPKEGRRGVRERDVKGERHVRADDLIGERRNGRIRNAGQRTKQIRFIQQHERLVAYGDERGRVMAGDRDGVGLGRGGQGG